MARTSKEGASLTVRFPAELRQRLRDAAERSGTRESDLVREAVELRLAVTEPVPAAYQKAKKSGIIGGIRSGIGDLSTNPKHFDGFGG
jgi:predicted DNA-binding protein